MFLVLLIAKHIFVSFRLIKQIKSYDRVNYLIRLRCPKIGSVLNFAQPASWIFKVPNSLESNQRQFTSSESKGLTYFLRNPTIVRYISKLNNICISNFEKLIPN